LASATLRPAATNTIISDAIADIATSPFANMAIEKGITEIADSQDEPMTSSSVNVSDEAARDKLSQGRQDVDALPEADGTHQALAQGIANTASDQAEGLDVDRNNAPADVHASNIDQIDLKLADTTAAQQEGATAEVCNHDQEELAQKQLPRGNFRSEDLPVEHSEVVNQEFSTDKAQHDGDVPVQHDSINARSSEQDANHVVHEVFVEPKATDDRRTDAAVDPPAIHQEQQFLSEAMIEEGSSGQPYEDHGVIENKSFEQSQDDELKAADEPSEAPCTIKSEAVESESDTHEVSDQPQDGVMSDDSPRVQVVDDDRPPCLDMDDDHPSEHAVCLIPTYPSCLVAHVPQASIDEATSATPSKSAALEEEEVTLADTPTSDVAEQEAAAVTVAQEDVHSGKECSEIRGTLGSVQDSDVDMDVHASDEGHGEPSLSPGEATSSVPEGELHSKNFEEQNQAAEGTSQTKASEQRGPDAAPIPTPAELTQQSQPEPVSARPAPPKTPQEITLAELKAQKTALLASLGALPAIQVLMEESASSDAEMDDGDGAPTDSDITAAANKIVKEHIKLLHEYNELKDVGQGLMGLIADQRGVRIVEVQEEFGIDAKD
jgi:hypothetical protein